MSSNQTVLKALAEEGIAMSEGELLNAVTALLEYRQINRQSPTRPSGRLSEPSIETRVTGFRTGWLVATLCVVGIGVAVTVTMVLTMAPAENTGNEDTGIYGQQTTSSANQSRSHEFQPNWPAIRP